MISAARRQRLVTFRVTEDEYARLLELSRKHGARTLSKFARDKVLTDFNISVVLHEINGKVDSIDSILRGAAKAKGAGQS